ncbi:beta-lactamase family protein [Flavobacteriaceae bacterium F89]|uniref:Beta-lactamase family protein n=1 Tax=Cerina litoralis TaxID=2874477 RepID=A0AAE3ETB3_9FLAO|nr:serine hydrolase domain-containing protein [Cerina litoralis]MCG2459774.1 beta-lactamase family protein [Cerina litoralis]
MKKIAILIGAVALGLNTYSQIGLVSGQIGTSVDTYLSRTVPFGFSGAVLVAQDGQILLNKGYGYADRSNKIENTIASVFSTGSLTKQFTAAAIMKLEMMGKINTDDKLGKYFENLPLNKQDITLYHLLTHTSGLPLAFSEDDFKPISKDEYLKKSMIAKSEFEPGAEFKYSNVGYVLLAMIIEKVSGLSYEEFLQKYLFKPAGMSQTGYAIPKWKEEDFVHIYNGNNDNGTTALFTRPTWHLIGNGGILSTTNDMFKWIVALNGNSILSEDAKTKMFTPFKNDYGFGWDVLDDGNLRQHNGGSLLGNGAELRWFVHEKLVTVIFTNSTIDGEMGFEVVRNELEALTMGDTIPLPPEIKTVSKDFTPYQGKYQIPSGATFTINVSDGEAKLLVENQEILDLLIDPENYKEGGSNVELNKKFENAFSKALRTEDFSGFDFTGAPEDLKNEINNELKLEGIENPYFKVVRTIPSHNSKDLKITQVALSTNKDFQGASLKLSIVTDNEKYAGIGVDFGFVDPISLGIYPVGGNNFQLYDLQAKFGAKMAVTKTGNGTYTFSFGNRTITAIKKID